MSLVRRLLSPEYWVVAEPGPPGRLWIAYAALGLAFLAGVALAIQLLFTSSRRNKGTALGPCEMLVSWQPYGWFELCVSLAGLVTIVGRFLGWPGWSARIWPPFLAALALVGAAAYHMRNGPTPKWLNNQLRVLALLRPAETVSPAGTSNDRRRTQSRYLGFALGCCLHLAGIVLVLQARFGSPAWLAPAVLLVLLLPQLPSLLRHQSPSLLPLTPLLAGYLVTILAAIYRELGITVVGWQGLSFPNPMTSLFYVDGILLASVAYSWLCQIFYARSLPVPTDAILVPHEPKRGNGAWQWAVILLLLSTSAWTVGVYLGKRTHGTTGSDPYAYAQMAVDLAARGTLLHRFSLFRQVAPLGIAWGPLLPSGYHLPVNALGDSPSVWATGASVLLAGGHRLLGEVGLYLTTPVIALLALAATWALVSEILRGESKPVRYVTGALAIALTATSPEHVDRLLVPMADASAQLFTVLTLVFVLRATRLLEESPRLAFSALVLGGFSFAWAYWVRHTQLVLLLPVAVGLWFAGAHMGRDGQPRAPVLKQRKQGNHLTRLWPVLTFSASAAIMAIPDAIYRWRVFGGLFATETTELPSMAIRHIGPMALQALRDMSVAGEWGYLSPFALLGCCLLARHHRRAFTMLAGAFVAVLLVHLTYRFLRLRDLISLFPLVNIAVSFGAVSLVRSLTQRHALRSGPRRLGPVVLSPTIVAWVVLSLALARWAMVDESVETRMGIVRLRTTRPTRSICSAGGANAFRRRSRRLS